MAFQLATKSLVTLTVLLKYVIKLWSVFTCTTGVFWSSVLWGFPSISWLNPNLFAGVCYHCCSVKQAVCASLLNPSIKAETPEKLNTTQTFLLVPSQGAHTTVVDRFVWLGLVQTQGCVISCRTSDRCSFRHIWQSSPPLPPSPHPSSHVYIVLYRREGGGVGKIVKYGGMSNDCLSDKRYLKLGFEQALIKQIGPQLLYGLPVVPFKNWEGESHAHSHWHAWDAYPAQGRSMDKVVTLAYRKKFNSGLSVFVDLSSQSRIYPQMSLEYRHVGLVLVWGRLFLWSASLASQPVCIPALCSSASWVQWLSLTVILSLLCLRCNYQSRQLYQCTSLHVLWSWVEAFVPALHCNIFYDGHLASRSSLSCKQNFKWKFRKPPSTSVQFGPVHVM